jgi:DNA-binding CsgD family transcriptional regulator
MSTTAQSATAHSAAAPSPAAPSAGHQGTVLVCAAPDRGGEPFVVLADGSYDTPAERVFWRHSPEAEVLRVPLRTQVSVRPVRHFPEQRSAEDGELRLLQALAAHRVDTRPARPAPGPNDAVRRRLAMALTDFDHTGAEALAGILWRQSGLATAHAALAECLDQLGCARADGTASALDERQAIDSVRAVLERLRATSTVQVSGAPVVLVSPEGDRHTLALTALAHELEEAGYRSLVVDDLPLEDLAVLLRERPFPAVVVSAHLALAPAAVRHLVATVRAASPDTLVAIGGPGAPRGVRGPDLVTDDLAELKQLLSGRGAVLTTREHEVLLAVADGRTNSEIAEALHLSTATVKTHLDHILAKTGTEHRAAAVARALREGWIT